MLLLLLVLLLLLPLLLTLPFIFLLPSDAKAKWTTEQLNSFVFIFKDLNPDDVADNATWDDIEQQFGYSFSELMNEVPADVQKEARNSKAPKKERPRLYVSWHGQDMQQGVS